MRDKYYLHNEEFDGEQQELKEHAEAEMAKLEFKKREFQQVVQQIQGVYGNMIQDLREIGFVDSEKNHGYYVDRKVDAFWQKSKNLNDHLTLLIQREPPKPKTISEK